MEDERGKIREGMTVEEINDLLDGVRKSESAKWQKEKMPEIVATIKEQMAEEYKEMARKDKMTAMEKLQTELAESQALAAQAAEERDALKLSIHREKFLSTNAAGLPEIYKGAIQGSNAEEWAESLKVVNETFEADKAALMGAKDVGVDAPGVKEKTGEEKPDTSDWQSKMRTLTTNSTKRK